jgi:serine/threonine protein kinase
MLAVNQLLQSRYVVVGKLGEGGMGTVYEARDQRLNVIVALKETKLHEDWLLKAFAQEAQMLAKLRHPGLPRVIDHFMEGDGQFLVMEFIPGDDLGSKADSGVLAFDLNEVLSWGDQLLDALHYLHTRTPPIIHRDVKPQNLKLAEDRKVILLDFGLAKSMLTGTVVYGFSNHYSSLEQKQAASTDARSDIYSFGATLYYLMTGRKPADAQSRSAASAAGQADPLLPIVDVNPSVGRAVSDVLMRALALEACDRPSTVSVLRRMLDDAREAASVDAATVVEAEAPRRIEIQLDKDQQATGAIQFGPAPSSFQQPHREYELTATAVLGGPRDRKPDHHSTSARELSVISKVRNWAARHFVVAVAQLIVGILAIALTIFLSMNSRPNEGKPSPKRLADGAETATSEPRKPERAEAMTYYVELKNGRKTAALAGGEPLSSDQRFKFHFIARSPGFLYIVAPGDRNAPMTFLTNRPMPDSGVTTNAVDSGTDFQFPNDNWIGLRDDNYQTTFTIVFSPERLTAPAFLDAGAGRTLTTTEQQRFDRFIDGNNAANSDMISEPQNDGAAMKLSVPVERFARSLLIFRIEVARR